MITAEKYDRNSMIFKELIKVKSSDPLNNRTYCLPKDHKEGRLKGRPIVAAVDSPSTKLSKLISKHLSYLLRYVPCHLKNCDSFLTWIKSISLDGNYSIVSFDVENLYGSIPYLDVDGHPGLFSIMDQFYREFQDASDFFKDIPSQDFMELFKLCLCSDTIIHENACYSQNVGLSMGNPIAPQSAIIFMNFIEQKLLSEFQTVKLQWKRYLDDCFLIYPSHLNCAEILNIANLIHRSIKFTMELPNGEGFLPFLDCEVKLHNSAFSSRIFFKSCHSGAIHHWTSHSSATTKRGIIMGELRRAVFRSTSEYVEYSTDKVFQRFLNNGYPRSFLNRTYRQFKSRAEHRTKEESKRIFIKCPFISEDISRKILNALKRTGLNNKIYLCFSNKSSTQYFRPPKEKVMCEPACKCCSKCVKLNLCQTKGVVYRVDCNLCDMIYIGETQRMIKTRILEHLNPNNNTSHVIQHAKNVHNGHIDFKWCLLHTGLHFTNKRRTLEAFYIRKIPGHLLMNGCRGINLQVP